MGDDEKPKRRSDLRVLAMRYDRNDLDQRLWDVDNKTLRPRFQSDLVSEEDRARLQAELDAARPPSP